LIKQITVGNAAQKQSSLFNLIHAQPVFSSSTTSGEYRSLCRLVINVGPVKKGLLNIND